MLVLVLDWRLSLLLFLALPLSYLITERLAHPVKAADRALGNVLEAGQSYLQDVFIGLRTVRAFSGQQYEGDHWAEWSQQHDSASLKTTLYHSPAFLTLGSNLINNLLISLIFGYGAWMIVQGKTTVGALVSFASYVPRVYGAFESLLRARAGSEYIRSSIEKLDELYALPQELGPTEGKPVAATASADIEFRDVSFHYDRGFGIEGLSFRAQPGEFVGIVGPSGGGKSTILDLLMGFHTPETGAICLDGLDIRSHSYDAVRAQIGFVPQEVFLWNASIRENLAYPGHTYSAETLDQAAKTAEIYDFIQSLPQGYETCVGERGLALSAGERQRLALARALLRQPRIILLDEATAALDAITEAKVRQALENVRAGRTVLVIAHRLITVMRADRILVVESGRLVEEGSPQELLSRRGLFYNLYHAQAPTSTI